MRRHVKTGHVMSFVATAALSVLTACSPLGEDPPAAEETSPDVTPETRVVSYLAESIEEGRVIEVSELVNDVFTTPEDRAAVDRLYDTFFKIPIFLVEFQDGTGELPTLEQIGEQFAFESPNTANVILSLMEADPRLPDFFERDASGELTALDVQPVLDHPQFGRQIERSIAGWEGLAMPEFSAETFDGSELSSADLEGSAYMVYVWFSNCPPCVETSPLLVELDRNFRDRGFQILALNADRYLELPYDDRMREDYVTNQGMEFRLAYLSAETHDALGGVSVFPTMFFVNESGTVVRHFVNFQEQATLEAAAEAALAQTG